MMSEHKPQVGDIWVYTCRYIDKPPVITYHLLIKRMDYRGWFKSLCLTDGDRECSVDVLGDKKAWEWVA